MCNTHCVLNHFYVFYSHYCRSSIKDMSIIYYICASQAFSKVSSTLNNRYRYNTIHCNYFFNDGYKRNLKKKKKNSSALHMFHKSAMKGFLTIMCIPFSTDLIANTKYLKNIHGECVFKFNN